MVVLLAGIAAAAQRRPMAAVRIEAPSPTHDVSSAYEMVVVAVGAPDVREVVITVNGVPSRAAVRDGRAVAPMDWIAGNNRVAVEARSRGRALRDSVTVFRRRAETEGFTASVWGIDGDPHDTGLHAVVDCEEGGIRRGVGITPGVHRVCLDRDDVDSGTPRRPSDWTGGPLDDEPADGRPARIGRRVRVEVRVFGGLEQEQRWVFNAWVLTSDVRREVGTFEVTTAMLAPGATP